MAYRSAVNSLILRRANRPLLAIRAKSSDAGQTAAEVGKGHSLWSPQLLKKHSEITPLLVIVLGGLGILAGFIFRNTLTRDDVRYRTTGKFGFEEEDTFDKPKKFIVFNQKYKTPEGLKELYEEMDKAEQEQQAEK